jgi:hypothetical protein
MFHSFHFANQVFGLREHEIRRGCAPGRHRGPGLRRGTDLPRNGDACTGNYRGLGDHEISHWGFHSHGGTPLELDGLENQMRMDDLGVPPF